MTNLFQAYRINCVVASFFPNADNNQYEPTPVNNLPIFGYAIDYEDGDAPSSVDDIREYSNYKETLFNKPIHIKIRPCVDYSIYAGVGTNAYGFKRRQWIRTTSGGTTAQHYGLKVAIYNNGGNQTVDFRYQASYYISWKDPH